MTYEKYILPLGPYQEGNLASVDLEMDASFPLNGVGVSLQVRDTRGRLLVSKSTLEGTIQVEGARVFIALLPEDTRGRAGKHLYEIDFINLSGQPFATIGGGFEIQPEINKS